MNSSAHFIRVAGRALPARKTTVLRLLDVQIRAVAPATGARKNGEDWTGASSEADANVAPLPDSSLAPAALPGRQLYFL
ncbi:MAG: hypothetical protein RIQ93_2187 [Verrucomicrobiota bacterium]|jgi:hypothetical protein